MPYSLKGNCVYRGDKKLKCYDNHADALAYFRALKINVKESLAEFSMYISKATTVEGVMRWCAVNSDTESDLYGEKMSLELYHKMLGYIKNETPPPEIFRSRICSDYWCGGMPYLSISHYPDLGGMAVPGEPLELFIDGKQLKARGYLFDNKLGNAVWKSLKEDEKKSPDEDKIRISIAFLDLAHKHGELGKVYQRLSETELCEECMDGVGNKIYLDGYLVHLALTRVPVNPRTLMEIKSMTKKTRKEDAESIVPDKEIVDEIDAKAALEKKSDVLVEMADTDDIEAEPQPVGDPPVEIAVVEDAKHTKECIKKEHTIETSEDDPEPPPDEKKKVTKKSLTDDDVAAIVEAMKSGVLVSEKIEKSPIEMSIEKLLSSVDNAVKMEADVTMKLESINPFLQEVGDVISEVVKSSVSVAKSDVATSDVSSKLILEQLSKLNDTITGVVTDVALLKSKSQTNENPSRVPVPRSLAPDLVKKMITAQPDDKPASVRDIVRRSVGLE